jgi:hypothetical protein
MDYILLDFGDFQGYQEIQNGNVARYVDLDGVELFIQPPVGNGGVVIDANPTRQDWML